MGRTTVSIADEYYAILEKWAAKEVRSVPNVIEYIVVCVLRGETPQVPDLGEVKQDE